MCIYIIHCLGSLAASAPSHSDVCVCVFVDVCARYEKQLQEEELSLQQQRRRLHKEVADEKERLAQLAAR